MQVTGLKPDEARFASMSHRRKRHVQPHTFDPRNDVRQMGDCRAHSAFEMISSLVKISERNVVT
jgi:hypothetical protein